MDNLIHLDEVSVFVDGRVQFVNKLPNLTNLLKRKKERNENKNSSLS